MLDTQYTYALHNIKACNQNMERFTKDMEKFEQMAEQNNLKGGALEDILQSMDNLSTKIHFYKSLRLSDIKTLQLIRARQSIVEAARVDIRCWLEPQYIKEPWPDLIKTYTKLKDMGETYLKTTAAKFKTAVDDIPPKDREEYKKRFQEKIKEEEKHFALGLQLLKIENYMSKIGDETSLRPPFNYKDLEVAHETLDNSWTLVAKMEGKRKLRTARLRVELNATGKECKGQCEKVCDGCTAVAVDIEDFGRPPIQEEEQFILVDKRNANNAKKTQQKNLLVIWPYNQLGVQSKVGILHYLYIAYNDTSVVSYCKSINALDLVKEKKGGDHKSDDKWKEWVFLPDMVYNNMPLHSLVFPVLQHIHTLKYLEHYSTGGVGVRKSLNQQLLEAGIRGTTYNNFILHGKNMSQLVRNPPMMRSVLNWRKDIYELTFRANMPISKAFRRFFRETAQGQSEGILVGFATALQGLVKAAGPTLSTAIGMMSTVGKTLFGEIGQKVKTLFKSAWDQLKTMMQAANYAKVIFKIMMVTTALFTIKLIFGSFTKAYEACTYLFSWMWKSNTHVELPEVVEAQNVRGLVITLAGIISLVVGGKCSARNVQTMMSIKNGCRLETETVFDYLEHGFLYCMAKITGDNTWLHARLNIRFADFLNELSEWEKLKPDWRMAMYTDKSIKQDVLRQFTIIEKIYDESISKAGSCPPFMLNQIAVCYRQMKDRRDDVELKDPKKGERNRPVVVWLWGDPGQGKSTLADPIARAVYDYIRTNYPECLKNPEIPWCAQTVWTRSENSDYWDGYTGSFAFRMEEFCATEDKQERGRQCKEFNNIVSDNALPLNMSKANEKGQFYFKSDLIMITTNFKDFNNTNMTDVGSCLRRIDYPLQVVKRKDISLDKPLTLNDINEAWELKFINRIVADKGDSNGIELPTDRLEPGVYHFETLVKSIAMAIVHEKKRLRPDELVRDIDWSDSQAQVITPIDWKFGLEKEISKEPEKGKEKDKIKEIAFEFKLTSEEKLEGIYCMYNDTQSFPGYVRIQHPQDYVPYCMAVWRHFKAVRSGHASNFHCFVCPEPFKETPETKSLLAQKVEIKSDDDLCCLLPLYFPDTFGNEGEKWDGKELYFVLQGIYFHLNAKATGQGFGSFCAYLGATILGMNVPILTHLTIPRAVNWLTSKMMWAKLNLEGKNYIEVTRTIRSEAYGAYMTGNNSCAIELSQKALIECIYGAFYLNMEKCYGSKYMFMINTKEDDWYNGEKAPWIRFHSSPAFLRYCRRYIEQGQLDLMKTCLAKPTEITGKRVYGWDMASTEDKLTILALHSLFNSYDLPGKRKEEDHIGYIPIEWFHSNIEPWESELAYPRPTLGGTELIEISDSLGSQGNATANTYIASYALSFIAAIGCWVGIGKMMDKFEEWYRGEDRAEGQSMGKNQPKKKRRIAKLPELKEKNKARGQMGASEKRNGLMAAAEHTWKAEIKGPLGKATTKGFRTDIFYVVPLHCYHAVGGIQSLNFVDEDGNYTGAFSLIKEATVLEDRDAIRLKLDKSTIQPYKWCKRLRSKDAEKLTGLRVARVANIVKEKTDPKTGQVNKIVTRVYTEGGGTLKWCTSQMDIQYDTLAEPDKELVVSMYYKALDLRGRAGDCGDGYVAYTHEDTDYIGFHSASVSSDAIITPIFAEDFPIKAQGVKTYLRPCVANYAPVEEYPLIPGTMCLGTLPKASFSPIKSEFQRSPIWNAMDEDRMIKVMPTIMQTHMVTSEKDGEIVKERIDPWKIGFQTYATPGIEDGSLIEYLLEKPSRGYKNFSNPRHGPIERPYTPKESVFGIPGRSQSLNKTASVTYEFKIQGVKDRTELMDDEKEILDERIVKGCEELTEAVLEGKQPVLDAESCGKSELLPVEKVLKGKMRIFMVGNLIFCIWMAMFLKPIFDEMKRHLDDVGCAIGINPHGYDWTGMMNFMNEVDGFYFGADCSKYDLTVKYFWTTVYWHWLCFQYGVTLKSRLGRILKGVARCCISFVFVRGTWLYWRMVSVASGSFATGNINSFVNYCIHRVVFKAFRPDRTWKFEKHLRIKTYGDDNAGKVSREAGKWYDMFLLQSSFKKYFGMNYTTPNKGVVEKPFLEFEELTFLARQFLPVINYHRIIYFRAPLETESIFGMLAYIRRSKEVTAEEQLRLNVKTAMYEMSLHGERTYNVFCGLVSRWYRNSHVKPPDIYPYKYWRQYVDDTLLNVDVQSDMTLNCTFDDVMAHPLEPGVILH